MKRELGLRAANVLKSEQRVTVSDKYFATWSVTWRQVASGRAAGRQSKYVPISRVVPTFYRGAIGRGARVGE